MSVICQHALSKGTNHHTSPDDLRSCHGWGLCRANERFRDKERLGSRSGCKVVAGG